MIKEQKRIYIFYSALFCMFLIPGAFALWEFMFELCEMGGSIVEETPSEALVVLKRMLPMIITAFTYVYACVWTFDAFRAESHEKRRKIWAANGYITAAAGLLISLYIAVGLVSGQYGHFIEGYPSALFPLDVFIGGLLFVLFGYFSVRYSKKQNPNDFYGGKIGGSFRVFHVFSYMVGICSFSAFCYGLFILDWSHGYIFFNIMVLLNYFAAFAQIIVYRFVFCHMTKEKRQTNQRIIALCCLAANFILFALYLLAVQIQNEAPNLNAFGIMPVDYTASINAYTLVLGANNLIAPLVSLIKSPVKSHAKSPVKSHAKSSVKSSVKQK